MAQNALTMPQQQLPEGRFLLPLCVTRQQVQDILDGLLYARGIFPQEDGDFDYMNPVFEGLAFVATPGNAPCVASTPESGDCTSYGTNSAIITFAPNDPRVNPEYVPPGYNFPPFYYQPGTQRIITTLERIPELIWGGDISNMPRFRVSFTGEGVVELHLVSVFLGGYALITVDGNPLSAVTAELNLDSVSAPPETNDNVIVEVPVLGEGAHYIDVTFIPRFNDEAPVVTFGGGIESVSLCGVDIMGGGEVATLRFKRKPAVGDYTLQIKVGDGDWMDTEYNFVGSPILATTIQPDVVDEDGIVVGSVEVTHDGNPIEDQIVRNIYTVKLNRAAFQGEPGEGEPGTDGHNVDMLDPALQEVLNPNEDPDIVIDNALPTTTFIGFKLPRAVDITQDPDIVRNPNEDPTVAMSDTTEGDKIIQFGLPRAQKIVSASAHALPASSDPTVEYEENDDGDLIQELGIPRGESGSLNGFDGVLPGLGEEKVFSYLVPADELFNLPFRIPAGAVIDDITGEGYWTLFAPGESMVVGAAGTVVSGLLTGQLRIGKKADQLTGNFAYEDATGEHVFSEDTWVSFAMHKEYPGERGGGWLWVSFRLSRPEDATINLTYASGGSGVASIESGDEFDLVLGFGSGFWNGQVLFDVPVDLELISIGDWTQGPYPAAVWDFYRADNTYGGFFGAPVDVPDESARAYGVNSGAAATIRLRATKAT